MKTILVLFGLATLTLIAHTQGTCSLYQCAPASLNPNTTSNSSRVCSTQDTSRNVNTTQTTVFEERCLDSSQYCPIQSNGANSTCTDSYDNSSAAPAGSYCNASSDCINGNCTKNICIGAFLNASCTNQTCDRGLYCDVNVTKKCQPLGRVGDICNSSAPCEPYAACMNVGNTSIGTCAFVMIIGDLATFNYSSVGSSKPARYLCKSFTAQYINGTYRCIPGYKLVNSSLVGSNRQCQYMTSFTDPTTSQPTILTQTFNYSTCGYSSKTTDVICPLGFGDVLQNITDYASYIYTRPQCNVESVFCYAENEYRFTRDVARATIGSLLVDAIDVNFNVSTFTAKIQDNDACTQQNVEDVKLFWEKFNYLYPNNGSDNKSDNDSNNGSGNGSGNGSKNGTGELSTTVTFGISALFLVLFLI